MARLRANLDAVRVLRHLQAQQRPASAEEQKVLARWSGWGAVSGVFDEHPADEVAWRRRYGGVRDELASLLSPAELRAARRTTVNAHYTDAGYVTAIWDALGRLGFDHGAVLEPGCGSGTFIGLAPPGADLVGVEWDPTTAAIAQALYPHSRILAESFAETRIPEGTFDAVVGNVPFADVVLTDRSHNPSKLSIHNHFIVKSLHLTRPGGMVAVLTSRYTMDAANPAARREIASLADLVGAVRLPSGAHRRAAGTDAVTDLLILRRREPGTPPAGHDFEQARPVDVDGVAVAVNGYFIDQPRRVLGRLAAGGMYAGADLSVVGDPDAAAGLRAALDSIVAEAVAAGLALTARSDRPREARAVAVAARQREPDGFLQSHPDATFTRVEGGIPVAYTPPASQAAELRALLRLRDTEIALLRAESDGVDDTEEMDTLRGELNDIYDSYVAVYGPLNRFGQRRSGRVDPATGDNAVVRVYPAQGGFREDPYAPAVYSLEQLDPVRQVARKADIFQHRVIAPRTPRLGADSPADAVAICLDSHGDVRLGEIARLLGVDEPTARQRLGELVFDEPATGRLVNAPEYLSGNVRDKLDAAIEAAGTDPRFAVNVAALRRVVPRDLGPGEIEARLGAAWIGAQHVQRFLAEILADATIKVSHVAGSAWEVQSDRRTTVLATNRWGTPWCPAPDIAQHLLEQRPIRLTEDIGDGKRVFSVERTIAAQEKAREMGEKFAEWVWQDPTRAAELAAVYNRTFNSLVLRSYDQVDMSLPGLATLFQPRAHQLAAVARVIAEPSVGLWHEVGAGKTAEMAIAAMELRRLGLARKPAIVVPNHMLQQFTNEFLALYPRAKLLAASTQDLTADKRRRFVAKATTGDWDAVIITRGAFERIPMSAPAQEQYLSREMDTLDRALDRAAHTGDRLAVKRLEKMRIRAEERIKASIAGVKDPGITFELTGVDYLFVDEAHGYKNLRTPSNVPNMSVEGSHRATDLHMKIEYLRSRSPRVVTFATATPIANSMGEAYTMLRYLRPDLLETAGVVDFDTFAATFGELVSQVEVAPEGGVRMNSRFAKFINVPELLRPWHIAGDVKTAEDLKLEVPALAPRPGDGQRLPETVIVAASDELTDYIHTLAARAEAVRTRQVDPRTDNMLRITHEGRSAALDLRLVGRTTTRPSKVDAAARTIADLWRTNRDTIYLDRSQQPHPRPGGLQLVFADLGTPSGDGWNVYTALRERLIEAGMARDQIRFIHDARNDRDKADLFDACRDGRVSVLIGSTEKMGVGTNVQERAIALHHLDCPWRPADLQQREGRIIRQGNQNPQVRVLRYVTEGSFDGYSWQTVTRKAAFIAQIMRGRLDVREIEDIGDSALSYNEVKALAAGNPLLLDHAQAQADLTRLERLERSHHHGRDALKHTIATTHKRIAHITSLAEAVEAALTRRIDTRADKFTMTVAGGDHNNRVQANQALRHQLQELIGDPRLPDGTTRTVGRIGGFDIEAVRERFDNKPHASLELLDVPASKTWLNDTDIATMDLVIRLENRLHDLEEQRQTHLAAIDTARHDIAQAEAQLAEPFRHTEALAAARHHFAQLDTALNAQAAPPKPPNTSPSSSPTSAPRQIVPVTAEAMLNLGTWHKAHADTIPTAPTEADQQWLATTAAGIAREQAVQAAAIAADTDTFAATFGRHMRSAITKAANTGQLHRDGFWGQCLATTTHRDNLAEAIRATAYTAIRTAAAEAGITSGASDHTSSRETSAATPQARRAFTHPPTAAAGRPLPAPTTQTNPGPHHHVTGPHR